MAKNSRKDKRPAVRPPRPMRVETSSLGKGRPSWDKYFMQIARDAATRATCDRKHVGAVIVRDKAILSTGYNGAPRGLPHCNDAGHEIVDGHCIRTVHAEANAIAQAAKNGATIADATIYTSASPCYDCFKLLINSGIIRVVYGEFYMSRYGASKRVLTLAKKAGIKMDFLKSGGK